jgi:hypothetical protein
LADAGHGELIGDFGEGLGVYVFPPCGCAAGEEGRAPVCCHGRELGWLV